MLNDWEEGWWSDVQESGIVNMNTKDEWESKVKAIETGPGMSSAAAKVYLGAGQLSARCSISDILVMAELNIMAAGVL
jgi:hypothetical protein